MPLLEDFWIVGDVVDRRVQRLDHRIRRFGRSKQSLPVVDGELRPKYVGHAVGVREFGHLALLGNGVGLELAGLDQRHHLLRRADQEIDVVAENVSHCRGAAAIRNLVEFEPGLLREQPRRKMSGGAEARQRFFQVLLLHQRHEFLKRVWRKAGTPDQNQRIAVDHHHRLEVLQRVEGQGLEQRRVRRNLQVVQQQRVAVRLGLGDLVGCNDRAAAGDVFDDEVLSELLLQLFRDHPRKLVGRSAGRVGHDDGDVAIRIGRGGRSCESQDAEHA